MCIYATKSHAINEYQYLKILRTSRNFRFEMHQAGCGDAVLHYNYELGYGLWGEESIKAKKKRAVSPPSPPSQPSYTSWRRDDTNAKQASPHFYEEKPSWEFLKVFYLGGGGNVWRIKPKYLQAISFSDLKSERETPYFRVASLLSLFEVSPQFSFELQILCTSHWIHVLHPDEVALTGILSFNKQFKTKKRKHSIERSVDLSRAKPYSSCPQASHQEPHSRKEVTWKCTFCQLRDADDSLEL